MQEAKAAANKETKRGGELLVSERREALRQELGRAQKHEIRIDEELQRMLSDRIADKDRVTAELRTQLDKHTSGVCVLRCVVVIPL